MKKMIILCMLFSLVLLSRPEVMAKEYTNFQEIQFENEDVKLLKDFSEDDYKEYYNKVKKRKMFGWRIYVAHKNEKLDYIEDTKIKVFNTGTTPISYEIKFETDEKSTQQITASGEIKVKGTGEKKSFKGSAEASIKSSISTSKTTSSKESYEFNIDVDPMTYVTIVSRGTGEINNGVGSYYFFWSRTKKGGWETFTSLTQYYEIVKARF